MEAPRLETPPDPSASSLAPALASAPVPQRAPDVARLHNDYNALRERLSTLPDKLSYNIMVPFGPFAFMPGKLVHSNEVTVLLGDHWFAKCSAKQAVVMKNFESRVEFTEDLQKMSDTAGDIVDIREEIKCDFEFKAQHQIAHKPHSKPKTSVIFEADIANDVKSKDLLADKELWARLEELERQEELLGELDSKPDTVIANGEDTTSSEEEKEDHNTNVNAMHQVTDSHTPCHKDVASSEPFSGQVNSQLNCSMNGSNSYHSDDGDDDDDDDDNVKDDDGDNDHEALGVEIILYQQYIFLLLVSLRGSKIILERICRTIRTLADIDRAFVDDVNGEYVPRRSILKFRSRENSVCSDTGESSAAEFDDRRGVLRSISCEEATCSDTSESILEEEPQENQQKKLLPLSVPEAFSGTVIEKEFVSPSLTPHPAIAHPALPAIPERKEVLSEASEETGKRVSKFKAARLQQKN
uniref:URI1 prefoldin like chaperone n=1 Tax=Nomascus leucogenys TaxID=61853 RepID=A0A2I3G7A7_NOMLE